MTKKKFFNKDLIFYIVMLALPLLQFCLFYIGVNGKSLLYSFQSIDSTGNVTWTTTTLVNAFNKLTGPYLPYFGRSFLVYLITYFIGTALALIFSYFIYKKLRGSSFFKVMLFMPSILSAIVISVIFLYFMNEAVPSMSQQWFKKIIKPVLDDPNSRFGAVIFYNIFISFGTSVLMYSNAMSSISDDVIEAGKLDGASPFREFFSIVIPSIFPTISTFAITAVAAIFVNQLSLYSIYTSKLAYQDLRTIGYQLFVDTVAAKQSESDYPLLSAMGLYLTIVAVPLTLTIKYLLEKFGPSEK